MKENKGRISPKIFFSTSHIFISNMRKWKAKYILYGIYILYMRYGKATRFFKIDRMSDRCTQWCKLILTKPLAAIVLYVVMLAPICAFTDANWCRSCHSCSATVEIGSVSIEHWPEIIAPPTKVSRSLFQYIRTGQRILLKRRSFRAACLRETSATSKCLTDDQESIAGLSLFEM